MRDIERYKKRKELLKHCDEGFYPHIDKVFARIPKEIVNNEVLGDSTLKIVTPSEKATGQYIPFEHPIEHLIILHKLLLEEPGYQIIHTIAHEFAHKITYKRKAGLNEKEAEDLMIQWGFKKESEEVSYVRPASENEGYEVGYKWAKRQNDLSHFEDYYDKWYKDCLGGEDWEDLGYGINEVSIFEELYGKVDEGNIERVEEMEFSPVDWDCIKKGIICGIMSFLKEKKEEQRRANEGKYKFLEHLSKVNKEIDELFHSVDSQAVTYIHEKLPELSKASVQICELLEEEERA